MKICFCQYTSSCLNVTTTCHISNVRLWPRSVTFIMSACEVNSTMAYTTEQKCRTQIRGDDTCNTIVRKSWCEASVLSNVHLKIRVSASSWNWKSFIDFYIASSKVNLWKHKCHRRNTSTLAELYGSIKNDFAKYFGI